MPNLQKSPLPDNSFQNGARITSEQKLRIHPIFGYEQIHSGIDIAVPKNTPVRSVADGKVIKVGTATNVGKMVAVEHTDGTISLYYHLNSFANNLKVGDQVIADQNLGASGNGFPEVFKTDDNNEPILDIDGNRIPRLGYHLHFGLIDGKQVIDGSTIRNKIYNNGKENGKLGFVESNADFINPRPLLADLAINQALLQLSSSDPNNILGYRDSEGNLKPLDQLTLNQQKALKAAANNIFPSAYHLPDPFLDEGLGQITLDGKDIYESLVQGENNKIYIGDFELSGKGVCLVDPKFPSEGEHSWLVTGSNDNKDYLLYRINDGDKKDPNGKDLLIVPLPQTETKNSIRITNFNFERALSSDNLVGIKLGYLPITKKFVSNSITTNDYSAALLSGRKDAVVSTMYDNLSCEGAVLYQIDGDNGLGSPNRKATVLDKNGLVVKDNIKLVSPNYTLFREMIPLTDDGRWMVYYANYAEVDFDHSDNQRASGVYAQIFDKKGNVVKDTFSLVDTTIVPGEYKNFGSILSFPGGDFVVRNNLPANDNNKNHFNLIVAKNFKINKTKY